MKGNTVPSRPGMIGPYQVRKTIGVGSFSKVKLAVHVPTGHKVALKCINRSKTEAKLLREIEILSLFRHPHIIRLYEVIYTPREVYMVVEYVQNGELFEYLMTKGRLNEDEARKMFQQLISGIEYCHARRVVHRDLKPENILLDKNHNVKIADFGLSNVMEDGYFFKTSCGSINYAAPEVISGTPYAGPEVDVWSAGVILFSMLCGRLPFDDMNLGALFQKIKRGKFEIPAYLGEDAKDILRRMIHVDPISRITIPEIRNHAFFRKNCASYLAKPSRAIILDTTQIDQDIAEEVVLTGKESQWTLDDVKLALDLGAELLMKPLAYCSDLSSIVSTEEQWLKLRAIAITYHIFLDEKLHKEKTDQDLVLSDSVDLLGGLESVNMDFKKQLQSSHLSAAEDLADVLFQRRWLLGYYDRKSSPANTMVALLSALKTLQFKWRFDNPYTVLAKCSLQQLYYTVKEGRGDIFLKKETSMNSSYASTPSFFIIRFQAYITPRSRSCVLDTQLVSPEGYTMLFLDFCSLLQNRLFQS